MRNQIANLCNSVSATIVAGQDALVERLQRVREISSLLYGRLMDNFEYGKEKLKDIAEKRVREEEVATEGKESMQVKPGIQESIEYQLKEMQSL